MKINPRDLEMKAFGFFKECHAHMDGYYYCESTHKNR